MLDTHTEEKNNEYQIKFYREKKKTKFNYNWNWNGNEIIELIQHCYVSYFVCAKCNIRASLSTHINSPSRQMHIAVLRKTGTQPHKHVHNNSAESILPAPSSVVYSNSYEYW